MNNKLNARKKTIYQKHRTKNYKRNAGRFILVILCIFAIVVSVKLLGDKFGNEPATNNIIPSISTPTTTSSLTTASASNDKVESDWRLILVNKWNAIPDNYTVTLMELKNEQSVDERIYPELQEMFDQARTVGIYPMISSSYRTTQMQQGMLDEKVNEFKAQGYSNIESETMAEKWVAIPGTSEHQIGLAIDIVGENSKNSAAVQQWLMDNSYKYGFILRYPSDKTEITGTNYEPWHYRYVGKETAAAIYNSGLCFEEYLKTLH